MKTMHIPSVVCLYRHTACECMWCFCVWEGRVIIQHACILWWRRVGRFKCCLVIRQSLLPCLVRLRFRLPHRQLKIGEHGGWAIAEVEPQIPRYCFFQAQRWTFSKLRACLLFSSDLWILKMYSRPVNSAEDIHLKNGLYIQQGLNVWEMYLGK